MRTQHEHGEVLTMTEKQRILLEIERELQDMTEEEKQEVLDHLHVKKNKGAA